MKLKSILYSIVALLSLVSFSIVSYASENETSSTVNSVVNDFENDLELVEDDFKKSFGYEDGNEEIYNDLKLERELQYRVYTVKNENIASSYETTELLSSNISEEYLLNIPISNGDDEIVGLVRFYCYEDGSCELYSFGKIEESELTINDKLALIENANEKKAVIFNRYNLIVLYYQNSNNEEYIEPITESTYISFDEELFNANAEENLNSEGINAARAADFISVLEEYEEAADINYDGTEVLYGNSQNIQAEDTSVVYKVSFTVMVISAGALIYVLIACLIKNKKRKYC